MASNAKFATIASLAGEPARAAMLHALMDGRALTASELARVAGITTQTACGHLAQLSEGGLISVLKQGRHRYHRLASPTVTERGSVVLSKLGIDVKVLTAPTAKPATKVFCSPCLDWSERRPHLARKIRAAICAKSFENDWILRVQGSRAVAPTTKGRQLFRDTLDVLNF